MAAYLPQENGQILHPYDFADLEGSWEVVPGTWPPSQMNFGRSKFCLNIFVSLHKSQGNSQGKNLGRDVGPHKKWEGFFKHQRFFLGG